MADIFSKKTRSKIMSCIRGKDTKCELVVRRLLHRLGFRFRLHRTDLPGSPDVVLPKYRTVVFVHGCFWHGHSCRDGKSPKSNQPYWLPKLRRNRERDVKNRASLRRLGWSVLTVWECEVKHLGKLERRLMRHLMRLSRRQEVA